MTDARTAGAATGSITESNHAFATIGGERYYVVSSVDSMAPFLMSVVSDGDRWMFISSHGGLTAGRRDPGLALFPYETDDRLHVLGGLNGGATVIWCDEDADLPWRPIAGERAAWRHRTLYRSVTGSSVILEERDERLGLAFTTRWASSERFGFVRTSSLNNVDDVARRVRIIDGIRNILPAGIDPSLYLPKGNLTNAYKRSELVDPALRFAVFSLESLITDRAEPAEAMRATVAWSFGLEGATVRLDPSATFGPVAEPPGTIATGLPGAYFLEAGLDLEPGHGRTWTIVADAGLDQPSVVELIHDLRTTTDIDAAVTTSTERTSHALEEIAARADGLQCTADEASTAHHLANVTYNTMRGGLPMSGYDIELRDFLDHLRRHNSRVVGRNASLLEGLPAVVRRDTLLERVDATGDTDLRRLAHAYLPFSFSRRHGDPSRPWNTFSIRVAERDGTPIRYFEGNWRDIFQNWEATAASFPDYLPGMIATFVNASTADGYNPYRITSGGIDWEVPEPDDPWSNIGYWGDHQIVYLLRLLEAADRYQPGSIRRMLPERSFAFASVPYRIAPYERIIQNPKDTITYDMEAASIIEGRVAAAGADGKLLWLGDRVHHVTFIEKLVIPALAKLSNLVPGGGIWMNTQRPEWNDANNALVGRGLSMVTLYQLRAYLDHLRYLIEGEAAELSMSTLVATWLAEITTTLASIPAEEAALDDAARRRLMDAVGRSSSRYRESLYRDGLSGEDVPVEMSEIARLCDLAIDHLDATIRVARREDGMYSSYTMLTMDDDGASASVEHLGLMLEGQVAVIESGVLDAAACADVVDAMFASDLYRPDQDSFVLYPPRTLPPFLGRNVIPSGDVDRNTLLATLVAGADDSVVTVDRNGEVRFVADITSKESLEAALTALGQRPELAAMVEAHGDDVVRCYERVFGHDTYTGRSGSMYAYEGIGSIYWHMVAKLLVAIQEAGFRAAESERDAGAVKRLVDAYERVRGGLGFNKTPAEHGAIPTDPYSHTPMHAGAQQPGMTGLVKEELLVRPAELGVIVRNGSIQFDTTFARAPELLEGPTTWEIITPSLDRQDVDLPAGSIGMTVCQVPFVISHVEGDPRIEVEFSDGTTTVLDDRSLGQDLSAAVFSRTGEVSLVRAALPW